jgi:hypothetical protein
MRIPFLSKNEHFHIVGCVSTNLLHHFTYPRHPKKALNSLYRLLFFFPPPDLYLPQTNKKDHDFGVLASKSLPDLGDTEKIMLVLLLSCYVLIWWWKDEHEVVEDIECFLFVPCIWKIMKDEGK